jgi:Tannase and feruloyl esterase
MIDMFEARQRSGIKIQMMATAILVLAAVSVRAQTPSTPCDAAGIGSVQLTADGVSPKITEVSIGIESDVSYCLIKVLVPQAINIWVGLPMNGAWNGRWQSVGGGVYAGAANVPTEALRSGYAAATTDTGHAGGRPGLPIAALDGSFGMLNPGEANVTLQQDFAYRSEHLMAVIGKQLVQAFYGKSPRYSYWNGCSTGGRQGLRMAQDYPDDYDGILVGAPAIHWDRFQAAMLWYPLLQQHENGGPIGGGNPQVLTAKYKLATDNAVKACDARDGVIDGVLTDPRRCDYSATNDLEITTESCTADNPKCLTHKEASVIDKSWQGPVICPSGSKCKVPEVASRQLTKQTTSKQTQRLWYGQLRGTDLSTLGGVMPFPVAIEQPRYWVYFDPEWDWHTLDLNNFADFFRNSVERVGPIMASDNPDLRAFGKHGKLVLWHGWSDQLINAQGTVDYYDRVVEKSGGLKNTQQFARLFMAPGVSHCAGGNGPQPQRPFDAVINWVEKGIAPDQIIASKTITGGTQTRPLCPYPMQAHWNGIGSSDDAVNFVCETQERKH